MANATIRAATLKDAERIYALVSLNSDMLVPRSLGNIVESIDRFVIAEAEGEMVGCASYQIHPEIGNAEAATVEIVSVAVKSVFRKRGIGRLLVEAIVANVRTSTSFGLNRLTFATIASTRRRPMPRLRNIDFTATDTISTVAASALPISG